MDKVVERKEEKKGQSPDVRNLTPKEKQPQTRLVSLGRSMEVFVDNTKQIHEKGKHELDPYLKKSLAKYMKQVSKSDVSKTNSLHLLCLCLFSVCRQSIDRIQWIL
jgi:hypothetical protein